ncbi:MAG: Hsp20 family protein [Xanthomonadales bacterium]|nr:Hsp20 family protein [Xanthomonadales bacterium]
MTTFDLSPLFRTSVGFERLANMLNNPSQAESGGFPPYNIEVVGEDKYRITMAVAGFSQDDLDITSEQNKLTVTGNKTDRKDEREYLYRGIAERSFERRFQLADHVRVTGAKLENGLLHIELFREVPEAMKPQTIEITGGKPSKLIEGEKEAQEAA